MGTRSAASIALPLLIMFKVICDHTPPLRVIGALIGAPLVRVNGRSEDETVDATTKDAMVAKAAVPVPAS